MARKRMIKPDFWQSPKMAEMDHFTRLLFIGLWQVADDHGNGPMEPALLAAELFPFDLSRDTQHILTACSRGTQELAQRSLIRVYEVNGRDFYSVTNFLEHQKINRPSNPVYPLPDQGFYKDSQHTHNTLTEDAGDTQETLNLKLREEKLREEKLNNVAGSDDPDDNSPKPDPNDREDIKQILDYLDQKIQAADPEAKLPDRTKTNKDAARLLLDRDKRKPEQVIAAIDFAYRSTFWWTHIRSMKKLRDKYDTLRAQAQQDQSGQRPQGQFLTSAERRYQQGANLVADELAEFQQQHLEIEP